MSELRIAARYARAIYRSAGDDHKDTYLSHLNGLAELFENDSIAKVLSGLTFPIKLKKEVFKAALDHMQADATFTQFIYELVHAGRVGNIVEIAKSYALMLDEANGLLRGNLVSATPLAPADVDTIVAKLAAKFNKKISLEQITDPSVLGGFVVNLGNQKLDYSLRAQIEKVAQLAMS